MDLSSVAWDAHTRRPAPSTILLRPPYWWSSQDRSWRCVTGAVRRWRDRRSVRLRRRGGGLGSRRLLTRGLLLLRSPILLLLRLLPLSAVVRPGGRRRRPATEERRPSRPLPNRPTAHQINRRNRADSDNERDTCGNENGPPRNPAPEQHGAAALRLRNTPRRLAIDADRAGSPRRRHRLAARRGG